MDNEKMNNDTGMEQEIEEVKRQDLDGFDHTTNEKGKDNSAKVTYDKDLFMLRLKKLLRDIPISDVENEYERKLEEVKSNGLYDHDFREIENTTNSLEQLAKKGLEILTSLVEEKKAYIQHRREIIKNKDAEWDKSLESIVPAMSEDFTKLCNCFMIHCKLMTELMDICIDKKKQDGSDFDIASDEYAMFLLKIIDDNAGELKKLVLEATYRLHDCKFEEDFVNEMIEQTKQNGMNDGFVDENEQKVQEIMKQREIFIKRSDEKLKKISATGDEVQADNVAVSLMNKNVDITRYLKFFHICTVNILEVYGEKKKQKGQDFKEKEDSDLCKLLHIRDRIEKRFSGLIKEDGLFAPKKDTDKKKSLSNEKTMEAFRKMTKQNVKADEEIPQNNEIDDKLELE